MKHQPLLRHFGSFTRVLICLSIVPLWAVAAPAQGIEALHLQLLDAGPNLEIVHVDADVDGMAALSIPSLQSGGSYGSSLAAAATGSLQRSGSSLTGDLSATVRSGALPGAGTTHALHVSISAAIDAAGVVEGTWSAVGGSGSGIVSGLLTELPGEAELDFARLLFHAGFPGDWSGTGNASTFFRVGVSAHLAAGDITEVTIEDDFPQASISSIETAVLSADPYGRPFYVSRPRGGEAYDGDGSGGFSAPAAFTGSVSAQVSGETTWTFELQRAGTLLFGTWAGSTGSASGSGYATGRLGLRDRLRVPGAPASMAPMDILSAHAVALIEHPFIGPFRDALLLMSRTGVNGDKNYDNPPYNVAGGVLAGLTLERVSSDPRERMIGRMIARNGAEFWRIKRGPGPNGLAVVYKGNSWMQAAAVEALGFMAAAEPGSTGLRALANQASSAMAARSFKGNDWNWLQNESEWGWLDSYDFHVLSDPGWVWWTHFERDGSGMGVSDSRNNRDRDHRKLPFGELIAAMSLVRGVDGGYDSWSKEVGHHRYLLDTMDIAPYWMTRHRAAATPNTPLSPVAHIGWLQWLVETGHADEATVDLVEDLIMDTFVDEFYGVPEFCRDGRPFLMGVYPRGGSQDQPDLASTARLAYILALRGKHDEAELFLRSVLGRASPWSGMIDFTGRQFINDMETIGFFDTAHPYTGLKATTGWYALEAAKILGLDTGIDDLPVFFTQWLGNYGLDGQDPDTTMVTKGGRPVNLREAFLLGEDPHDPSDVYRVRELVHDAGEGVLTVELDTLPNRVYQVEVSSDLGEGSWVNHGSPVTGTGGPHSVTLPPAADGDPLFVRIRISFP
ncbi:MAG: hypothetical protein JJU00_00265 [Opitutales bacterium]|nr:hypothetical protein [Opitutales bacterium]